MAFVTVNIFGQSTAKRDSNTEIIWADEYTSQGTNKGSCSFLVFLDNLPWGSSAVTDILSGNGESFTVANSAQMSTLNFSSFDVIIIESDQVPDFYVNFKNSFPKFNAFVIAGGRLEVHAATCGWNSPCPWTVDLPGGVYTVGLLDPVNDAALPSHPIVEGVLDPFIGNYASHGYFTNMLQGTDIITTSQSSGLPTTIQYSYGAGTVTATTCTYEHGYTRGNDMGTMLVNNLDYSCSGYTPPPKVPISNWSIYISIFLIIVFILIRVRKEIA